jgi:hypothetical protein
MLAKSENILGASKKRQSAEWISEETWNEIKARKDIKQKINNADDTVRTVLVAEYSKLNKRVKRSARRDKRACADKLHTAQLAAEAKNSRELYQVTQRLAGRPFRGNQTVIRDATGLLLAAPQDQLNRWHEYFRNSLAAPPLHTNVNTTELPVDTLNISSDAPTVKEIKIAIKHLKSNKASGPDNLPP